MVILTVAPLARGIPYGTLTYFSKDLAPIGSLVRVPVGKREVPGIVLAATEASQEKAAIKQASFTIRSIGRMRPRELWLPEFIRAAEKLSTYTREDFGEILLALTPKAILEQPPEHSIKEESAPRESKKVRLSAAQATTRARIDMYQRLIREAFAQKRSVFVCVSQEIEVERLSEELSRGIEPYTLSLTGSTSKKKMFEAWEKAYTEAHPLLVIGTPQYLSLPRIFQTIIIEEEQARTWKRVGRPHIDMRIFAEYYARALGSTLIFGASLLRPETHARIQAGEVFPHERITTHAHRDVLDRTLSTQIVDPRLEERAHKERTGVRIFSILSEQARLLITQAKEQREGILLISARKGLSPLVRCGDCGSTVACPECSTPLVLHGEKGAVRVFSCHACGYVRTQPDQTYESCVQCGSWKLEGMGIGTERILEELATLGITDEPILFDGDQITTRAQARKCIALFEKKLADREAPILVATPMVIPYLKTIPHTIVVSLDALFAIPDIRMPERVFSMLLALREKTERTIIVQTRLDDTAMIREALEGELAPFIERELALRKAFSYPPFGTIIKITIVAQKETCRDEALQARDLLSPWNPIVPPTMARRDRDLYAMHTIIKVRPGLWENLDDPDRRALAHALARLPQSSEIEINPDSLL